MGGIVRVHEGLDGTKNAFVFTWTEGAKDKDPKERKWASGSGASVFYNMSAEPNTHMTRDFENQTFEIHALRDIAKDEELTHVYISATWRACFKDLKPMAEAYLAKQTNSDSDAAATSPNQSSFADCCTSRDKYA